MAGAYLIGMSLLDRVLPSPQLRELDRVDLAVEPARVYARVRHGDLADGLAVARALFWLRELPQRLRGRREPTTVAIDAMQSSPERAGFQVLLEDPPHECVVGAIGKVWQLVIPFVHVADAKAYADFDSPGQIKVAWAMRVLPRGERDSTLELEVRVQATDEPSWHKFRRYFAVVGPGSRLIRHRLLAALARELGDPVAAERERAMPGDALLPDAAGQVTHGITIEAPPERIWPWLAQMGCRKAGFYSIDLLDNGGVPSARELHPEWAMLAVGDVIPATPKGDDGFEVLVLEPPRTLVLGGLFDRKTNAQLPFGAARPKRFQQVTWAFDLERLDAERTRLRVRVRAAFSRGEGLYIAWIRLAHHVMQTVQLRNLAARAEGRLQPVAQG